MSRPEDEHAELVVEVAELEQEVEAGHRRFINSWMHHPEFCERLTTLSEWAEARRITRFAAYDLRRRHADFPRPLGSSTGR